MLENGNMRKKKSILQFAIGLMSIVVCLQLADRLSVRWDLTEEGRFSVSPATVALLSSLQEPLYVEVFLEGEMPSGFKRLRNSIDQILDQFAYYSDNMVVYSFTDPTVARSTKARNEYFKTLVDRGLQPTNLSYSEGGNKTEKLIFPGAIVSYFGKELPVTLLSGNQASGPEERLNQSIEGLEYELADVIRQLASDRRKNVGLILGHEEPDSLELAGLTAALMEKYNVFNVDLPDRQQDLSFYDAIVLPKPTTAFSESEKYKLDQYLVKGGNALFFIDALRVNMDSASGEGTFAFPYELGLDDMLFKYGVRINREYVQDVVCGNFPVVAGNMGDQPQIRMLPWPFFPIINNFGKHPITKNLDAVAMKFVSTIDSVRAVGITKTPLLMTSEYSMISQPPVKVSFNELQKNLDPKRFDDGSHAVAYLLEGKFSSVYKNRILPKGVDKSDFSEEGNAGKLMICADGDIIRNEFDLRSGDPLQLGASPYNQIQYANQDFVINTIDYMLNDAGVVAAKSKELKIRPLDKVKIAEEKLFWQVLNLAMPIMILVVFGVLRTIWRKRKYSNF